MDSKKGKTQQFNSGGVFPKKVEYPFN